MTVEQIAEWCVSRDLVMHVHCSEYQSNRWFCQIKSKDSSKDRVTVTRDARLISDACNDAYEAFQPYAEIVGVTQKTIEHPAPLTQLTSYGEPDEDIPL